MTKRMKNVSFFLLATAFLAVLGGCDNFMTGSEDLKDQMRHDVDVANAEEVSISIGAEDDAMGVTSPLGVVTAKVGVSFNITTTVSEKYTFLGWSYQDSTGATGTNGDAVSFADSSSKSTSATVNKAVSGLSIVPLFDRRPYPMTWFPYSGTQDNLINKSIVVMFNEPISPVTADDLGEGKLIEITSIKTYLLNGTDTDVEPTHVEDRFDVAVSGRSLSLTLKSGEYHDRYSTVNVTLSSKITDLEGNRMTDDFSWFFQTGSGIDDSAPVINSFKLVNAKGIESSGTGYAGSNDVTLEVDATDDQSVTQLVVIETPWSSGSSSGTALDASTGSDTVLDYLDETDYSLGAAADGWFRLQIRVGDENGNWTDLSTETSANTLYVYRDTVVPSASIGAIGTVGSTGDAGYAKAGDSITFPISVSEDTGKLSGAPTVTIGGVSAEVTGDYPDYTASLEMDGTVPEGTLGYTVDVQDQAGNDMDTISGSTGILLDRTAPVIGTPAFSIQGRTDGYAKAEDVAQVTFTLTDTGGSTLSGLPTVKVAGEDATVGGSASPYTATYELQEGDTQGALTYKIDASDRAGNTASKTATTSITYDSVPPTVTIASPATTLVKGSSSLEYTLTFDQVPSLSNSALEGYVVLTPGTGSTADATADITGSGATRTLRLTPFTGNGTLSFHIAAGTMTDAAGNVAPASAESATFTVDTAPPTVTFAGPSVTAVNASGSVSYTLTFSEGTVVDNTALQALVRKTATGGAAAATVAVTGDDALTRTVTLSGFTGNGTIKIYLAAGFATDSAGNVAVQSSASDAFTVDTIAPTVTIGSPSETLVNGSESVSFSLTFSEGTVVDNATLQGLVEKTLTDDADASAVAVSGTDDLVRTVTLSGFTGDGTIKINLAAGFATDSAGNVAASSSLSAAFTVDTTLPTVTVSSVTANPVKSGGTATFTVTYSGYNSVLLSSATKTTYIIVTTTGTAETPTVAVSGTGATRNVTLTAAGGDGLISFHVASGSATDTAGNAALASGESATVIVDNSGPDVTSVTATSSSGGYYSGIGTAATLYYKTDSTALTITPSDADDGTADEVAGLAGYAKTSTGTAAASFTFTPTSTNVSGLFYAIDEVGNASSQISVGFVHDTLAPTIDTSGLATALNGTTLTVGSGTADPDESATVTGSGLASAVSSVGSFDGSTITGLAVMSEGDASQTITLTATDNVSRTTTVTLTRSYTSGGSYSVTAGTPVYASLATVSSTRAVATASATKAASTAASVSLPSSAGTSPLGFVALPASLRTPSNPVSVPDETPERSTPGNLSGETGASAVPPAASSVASLVSRHREAVAKANDRVSSVAKERATDSGDESEAVTGSEKSEGSLGSVDTPTSADPAGTTGTAFAAAARGTESTGNNPASPAPGKPDAPSKGNDRQSAPPFCLPGGRRDDGEGDDAEV